MLALENTENILEYINHLFKRSEETLKEMFFTFLVLVKTAN